MKRPILAVSAAALLCALFCAPAAHASIRHAKPAHHTAKTQAHHSPQKAAHRVAVRAAVKPVRHIASRTVIKPVGSVAAKPQRRPTLHIAAKPLRRPVLRVAAAPQRRGISPASRIATRSGAVRAPIQKMAPKNTLAKIIFKQGPKPTVAGRRLTNVAKQVATKMNTVGWCYAGVCRALGSMGIALTGDAAYEAKDQLITDKRFKLINVKSPQQLAVGDILVHGKNDKHPYGHIAIYIGNDQEASDHIQPLIFKGPYNGTTVFRIQSTDA